MEWIRFLVLPVCVLSCAYATRVYYVLPDNSTNSSCPLQPCATLSKYLSDGLMSAVSNIEYRNLDRNFVVEQVCTYCD